MNLVIFEIKYYYFIVKNYFFYFIIRDIVDNDMY